MKANSLSKQEKSSKPSKRRGTIKQQRLAKAIVENMHKEVPLTAGQMLENVGYSPNVAVGKPAEIMESEGVEVELALLGFTEANAKSVVATIMDNEDEKSADRLKAAEMVFKVHGSFAEARPPVPQQVNYNLFYKPEFQEKIKAFEDGIKNLVVKNVEPTEGLDQGAAA